MRGLVLVDAAAGGEHSDAFQRAQSHLVQVLSWPVVQPIADATFSQLAAHRLREAGRRAPRSTRATSTRRTSTACSRSTCSTTTSTLRRRAAPRRRRDRGRRQAARDAADAGGRHPGRRGPVRQARARPQTRRDAPPRPPRDGERRPHGAVRPPRRRRGGGARAAGDGTRPRALRAGNALEVPHVDGCRLAQVARSARMGECESQRFLVTCGVQRRGAVGRGEAAERRARERRPHVGDVRARGARLQPREHGRQADRRDPGDPADHPDARDRLLPRERADDLPHELGRRATSTSTASGAASARPIDRVGW